MKFLSLFVVAALAFTSTTTDAARFISNSAGRAVPDSYIVVLKDSSTVDSFQPKFNNMVARHNARGGRRPRINHRFKNIHGFTLTGSRTTLNELLSMDEIDYVEQDSIVTIDKTQTSPPSWGLGRVSSRKLTGNGKSYKYYASGGKGVTVYVVDTGINTAHADFGGRAKMGKNFITGSPNTDENGHGTHVAGTIGGTQYGVAKRANLVGVKVLSKTGSGSTSGIIAALDWIATASKGKKAVVNMSLGGGRSQAFNDAVARVHKAGIPVIVAA
ncbi:Subtilisin-like protease 3, partial [Mortierella polycephala]